MKRATFTWDEIVNILFGTEKFRDWQLAKELKEVCDLNNLECELPLP